MLKYILLSLLLFPVTVVAQSQNAGFVEGLWYSKMPFFAGEEVRVYAALRNNTGSDLSGTVRFTDNTITIGEKPVEALDGRLVETWIDWTPSSGNHQVRVVLVDAVLDGPNSEPVAIEVASAE